MRRWVVLFAGSSAFLFGCGGELASDLFKDAGTDGTSVDVTSGDVTSGDAGDATVDATIDACAPKCSDDLHQVLDCNGVAIKTCAPNEGCSAAACVPACDAVAARPSNLGCDFYTFDPDVLGGASLQGACYAVAVTNPWTTDATLGVERGGNVLAPATFGRIVQGKGKAITYAPLTGAILPAGATALLFLARGSGNPSCPAGITPAVAADTTIHGTGLGSAFHVTATVPVVVSDFAPYAAGGAPSGVGNSTMLYPTTSWGTNYVVVDAFVTSGVNGGFPSTDIVALADGTQVTLKPTVDITGGNGVAAATNGVSTVYTLNKGQILQITQPAELTGSPIEATKPVGLWGAHTCMNIEPTQTFCDSGHQELVPIVALGSEYVAARYRSRDGSDETPPWRIVGAADGTVLTWDPAPPTGAPTTLSAKQLATFKAAGPFSVKSQDSAHPFYLSAHMTGGSGFSGKGDPEFVNVIPSAQWMRSYSFFTDPAYPESNLVFVRKKGASGFADVTLDCAGKLGGWTPVGAGGVYEMTRADLSTGNFVAQGSCDNGTHTASSAEPFTVTAWGWGANGTTPFSANASYAITAGALATKLNSVSLSAK